MTLTILGLSLTLLLADVTAYTHTGNPTASGVMPLAGRTVACRHADRSSVFITSVGWRVCEDKWGHSTDYDIFMNTEEEALVWGRKKLLVIKVNGITTGALIMGMQSTQY